MDECKRNTEKKGKEWPLWNGGGIQGNLHGGESSLWALYNETCIRWSQSRNRSNDLCSHWFPNLMPSLLTRFLLPPPSPLCGRSVTSDLVDPLFKPASPSPLPVLISDLPKCQIFYFIFLYFFGFDKKVCETIILIIYLFFRFWLCPSFNIFFSRFGFLKSNWSFPPTPYKGVRFPFFLFLIKTKYIKF